LRIRGLVQPTRGENHNRIGPVKMECESVLAERSEKPPTQEGGLWGKGDSRPRTEREIVSMGGTRKPSRSGDSGGGEEY